jgi:hypothetical protein
MEDDSGSVEEIGPPRKKSSSHSIALGNFDGKAPQVVEADEYYICIPTKDCIQFWATLVACFIVSAVSLILMIIRGTSDPLFYLWEALFAFAFGVLVPSPNYSTAFRKPLAGSDP